jgi:hypothetical protein
MVATQAVCVECRRPIKLGPRVRKGSWFACPHCGVGLEIINLDPPMVTFVANRPLRKTIPGASQ